MVDALTPTRVPDFPGTPGTPSVPVYPHRRAFDFASNPKAARNALGLLDAPQDGSTYGMKNGQWVVTGGGGGGIPDAPNDGKVYGRQSLGWTDLATLYQPLDGDLTSLAAASGTNTIYYRSGTSTWTPVVVGTGLSFSGGTLSSTVSGGIGEAPNDGFSYLRGSLAWQAGGSIKGSLALDTTSPAFTLKKNASGQQASIQGVNGANARWVMYLGDSAAEGGSNAGSNFAINRYNDAGVGIDTPFSINRASGEVSIKGITNGSNAAAGMIGEYVEVIVSSGSATALANNLWGGVTGITLTAGDWDVTMDGILWTSTMPTGAFAYQANLSTTLASSAVQFGGSGFGYTGFFNMHIGPNRFSLASSSSVYVNCLHTSGATQSWFGTIHARRVR